MATPRLKTYAGQSTTVKSGKEKPTFLTMLGQQLKKT